MMKYGYLADAQTKKRLALCLMLLDLNIQVVDQAADWMASNDPEAESAKMAHSRGVQERRVCKQM
jgi:hypothetical protein